MYICVMDFYEFLVLVLMVGGIWFWFDIFKVWEVGVVVVCQVCVDEGLQFFDEMVVGCLFCLVCDENGQFKLCCVYFFEYSDIGNDWVFGSVILFGSQVEILYFCFYFYVVFKVLEKNEIIY